MKGNKKRLNKQEADRKLFAVSMTTALASTKTTGLVSFGKDSLLLFAKNYCTDNCKL
jgi:hypothetical protein